MALIKPPKAIRIAFVGASTTINVHAYDFSPSERVVFWLNRYAQARGLDVRFEVLNAGREGINSEDIAAIVSTELAALDPDLVVYYEGSNQFNAFTLVGRTNGRDRMFQTFEWFRKNTAIGELVTQAGVTDGSEPPKPWHTINWPNGVDWQTPNVDSRDLPLNLPTIVHDLDTIREAIRPGGGQLLLCSFQWLSRQGLVLSGSRKNIYDQLNGFLWPLTYDEIRRIADFRNVVFRRYAANRGITFLDVAGGLPEDPDFYSDAIHMTYVGERVRAWVMFQQLLPIVKQEIDSGHLPRKGAAPKLPPPADYSAAELSLRCQ